MKKTIVLGVIAFLMAAGSTFASGPAPKAVVIHNGKAIVVSCHALPAHRAHQDKVKAACKKVAPKK